MSRVRFQNNKLICLLFCAKRINFQFICTGLHQAILEIVAPDAGANERTRTEV